MIAVAIICIVIVLMIILAGIQIKKFQKKREQIPQEPPADEIFKLVSRVKYPVRQVPQPEQLPRTVTTVPGVPSPEVPEKSPKKIDLIKNRVTITESLQALAEKYSVLEITLGTDDGLVLASSTERDVTADAAKYSQIARQQVPPVEPGITLFELHHKEAHIVGIVRSDKDIPQDWKKEIREDAKGILQWWL